MNRRIGGAVIFGIALVAIAFFVRFHEPAMTSSTVSTIPTEQTSFETNQDWEALLKTRMERSTEDEEAIADDIELDTSITGTFARTFFENYLFLSAQGNLTAEQEENLINSSISSLRSEATDRVYTLSDIPHTTEPSLSYLRTYGNALAIALRAHPDPAENELVVFQRAVETNEAKHLADLTEHESTYDAFLKDLLSIEAPIELQDEHLVIVNATLALRNDVRGMMLFFEDPLYATLRVQRYTTDLEAVYAALRTIYSYLEDRGIRYTEGEPAAIIKVQ
ncbi:hypothetical protein KTR10_00825 [Candidatus Kaiserbacteria bacterium]|nr:hypothetical protein [Candidatus Kaiserbacteria bacterium]